MKKLLAIVLALTLALSLASVAFAAAEKTEFTLEDAGSENAEVWVVIEEDPNNQLPENPDDVDADDATYKVEIDATDAVFTYVFDGTYNVDTHAYDNGGWKDDTEAEILITNHSNTSINVTAAWKEDANVEISGVNATFNGVTATITDTTVTPINIGSAVNSADNPPSGVLTVSVGEDDVPTVYDEFRLDYITITISGTNAD